MAVPKPLVWMASGLAVLAASLALPAWSETLPGWAAPLSPRQARHQAHRLDVTEAERNTAQAKAAKLDTALAELAREHAISVATLHAVAVQLAIDAPDLDPADILRAVREQTSTIRILRAQLAAVSDLEPEPIPRLNADAAKALDEGRLKDADRLLAQIIEARISADAARRTAQKAANDEADVAIALDLIKRARLAAIDWRFADSIGLLNEARARTPPDRASALAFIDGLAMGTFTSQAEIFHDLAATDGAIALHEKHLALFDAKERSDLRAPMRSRYADMLLLRGQLSGDAAYLARAVVVWEGVRDELRTKGDRLQVSAAEDQLVSGLMALGRKGDAGRLEEARRIVEAQLRTPPDPSPAWRAYHLSELGVICWLLSEVRTGPALYEQAIASLSEAISLSSDAPEMRTAARLNLGGALSAHQRDAEAIEVLSAALAEVSEAERPAFWAELQNSLGGARARLADQTRSEPEAVAAISALDAALRHRDKARNPAEWAVSQMNLGSAWSTRFEIAPTQEAFEKSLGAYQSVLTVRTCETDPLGWSDLNQNIGNLFLQLADQTGRKVFYLEAAVHGEVALLVLDRESQARRWSKAQWLTGRGLLKSSGLHGESDAFTRQGLDALADARAVFLAGGDHASAAKVDLSAAVMLEAAAAGAEPALQLTYLRLALDAAERGAELRGALSEDDGRFARDMIGRMRQRLAEPSWSGVSAKAIRTAVAEPHERGCPAPRPTAKPSGGS